jgi:hypothetical protein
LPNTTRHSHHIPSNARMMGHSIFYTFRKAIKLLFIPHLNFVYLAESRVCTQINMPSNVLSYSQTIRSKQLEPNLSTIKQHC